MLDVQLLLLILFGWVFATATPGPATIAVISSAVGNGRNSALIMAAGVWAGGALWGVVAAAGMGVVMYANAWFVEAIKYLGAAYLMYLAYQSLRRAFAAHNIKIENSQSSAMGTFIRGVLIHVLNPKAIFMWGPLFAVVLPADTGVGETIIVLVTLLSGSAFVFFSYALLFSSKGAVIVYSKISKYLELGFAGLFGFAGLKLLTSRINAFQ